MTVSRVDYSHPAATICRDSRKGFFRRVKYPFWEEFFDERIQTIFEKGGTIIDIGGGLRIDPSRGNRVNEDTIKKFGHYLSNPNINFRITDYTDKYSPDLIEDIHRLSFQDNSIDALFCLAILEHVYDPKKAAEELVRVLKKGGMALIYVPFIYRHHSHTEDYKDYFRFSKDGISYLFRQCSSIEICPVRGTLESLLLFLPLRKIKPCLYVMRALDMLAPAIRRISEVQTSGYHIFITK